MVNEMYYNIFISIYKINFGEKDECQLRINYLLLSFYPAVQ